MVFLIGCASIKEVENPNGRGLEDGSALTVTGSYASVAVGDSTHPGGTWGEERDSVKNQVHLVTLVIIVAAMVVLAFTLGTAGKGG